MKIPSLNTDTQRPQKGRIFTATFVLICLASFAFFASLQMFLPTLPLFVVAIGGRESEMGLVVGAFTISSLASRPFIGRAVDTKGRKIFLLVGAGIFLISSLLYIPAATVPWLLVLRLLHGIGIATFTTAATALVVDISPIMRRGEAMGYFGMASNISLSLAPALGIVLMQNFGFVVLFLAAAGAAATSLALSLAVADRHDAASIPTTKMSLGSFFSREALFPSLLVFCLTATYGVVVAFLPIYVVGRELGNPGLFFTIFAVALVITRPVAGRLSDILGRRAVILPGMLVVASAMGLLAVAPSFAMLAVAGVLYGVGFGSVHPALLAWVADKAGVQKRGAAMATFTAAFDLGIGSSAVILGVVLEVAGFATMWGIAGGIAVLGFALALANRQQKVIPAGK